MFILYYCFLVLFMLRTVEKTVEGKVPWNTGTILPSSICTENGLVFSPLPLARFRRGFHGEFPSHLVAHRQRAAANNKRPPATVSALHHPPLSAYF